MLSECPPQIDSAFRLGLEEREENTIIRRIHDARLPRNKTREGFDFLEH